MLDNPCHILAREVVHCIPTRRQHMRLIYRYATDYSWLTAYRNWAPYRYIVLALSTVRFHRYCNVLRGQDVRLEQGARNLIERMVSLTPMDLLPRFYRRWFAKSCGKDIINNSALQTPLPAVDDSTYIRHCILDGPWFAGWASADHQSCDGSCEDMEDYFPSAACNGSCGKASPSPAWITSPAKSTSPILDNLDTTYSIPCQRGVDNSAYTWRKDYALGRGVESTNEPSYALRYASALAISGILLFALQRSA